MIRRLLASVLVALVLAGSSVSMAAASHRYLICKTEAFDELYIVIENFGGMGGAVHHCVHFWHGHPIGVEN